VAILSGELEEADWPLLNRGTSRNVNGNGFVFYTSGVNPGTPAQRHGGGPSNLHQCDWENATVTSDENNNGTLKPEVSGPAVFSVDATGRMTVMGLGSTPPITYLIDSTRR